MRLKTIIWIITIILLITNVLAIGVGPVKTIIEFTPNLETQYSIDIYNTDNKNFEAILTLEGELKEYIEINSNTIIFTEEERSKKAFFNVSFPRDIPPGTYTGKLRILESNSQSEGTITASLSVVHNIILEVPKHGKYLKATIEQTNKNINVNIENIGLNEIKALKVINTFSSSKDNFSYTNERANFLPDEVFNYNINLNDKTGSYTLETKFEYDELTKKKTQRIKLGEIELQITNLETNNFKLGEIGSFITSINSNWNEKIKIRAEIDVMKDDELIETIKGPDELIDKTLNTTLFWDTTNYQQDNYNLIIKTIHEEEVINTREYDIELSREGTILKEKSNYLAYILIIIIFILLAIITYVLKNKNKRTN